VGGREGAAKRLPPSRPAVLRSFRPSVRAGALVLIDRSPASRELSRLSERFSVASSHLLRAGNPRPFSRASFTLHVLPVCSVVCRAFTTNRVECLSIDLKAGFKLDLGKRLPDCPPPRTTRTSSQMDGATPQTVAQTVAQAVQAATQQQQQQQAQQVSQPSPPQLQHSISATPSSTIDNLTCQWQGCGERCDSAEALYVSMTTTRRLRA